MRVLVVEDEQHLAAQMREALEGGMAQVFCTIGDNMAARYRW